MKVGDSAKVLYYSPQALSQVNILRHEGASCMNGFIARAGKLTLTGNALNFVFRNEKLGFIEIDLREIDQVDFFKSLSIIPNGLTLFLYNGDVQHFVVDDRIAWKSAINEAKERYSKDA